MAEVHGSRIAALLAADAQFYIGTNGTTELCRHFDQFSDALHIQFGEGVKFLNLPFVVGRQELSGIIP